ncbi:shikimate kinase [Filimonas effusa]|uniref:Shikimate kinase n=1 Tax=Filimonas effusa TaxID=2508721 RepID=A0A4Q1D9T3_9BACT|nr:shikimate kinase [Filimonas effusa]RXK85283.1 shikimate kinase [Filimonas effusa]
MKFFLLGMMGTGKSFWAKKMAKKNKSGAYDLDHLIESLEDRTISELFAEEGEAWFRQAEAKLLRWFGEKKSFVLATGGGTPCFNENMEWMNKHGITIWIDSPIELMVQRLIPEKDHRPLIRELSDAQLADFLTAKLAERTPFYQKATYHLKGDDVNEKNLMNIIKKHA